MLNVLLIKHEASEHVSMKKEEEEGARGASGGRRQEGG